MAFQFADHRGLADSQVPGQLSRRPAGGQGFFDDRPFQGIHFLGEAPRFFFSTGKPGRSGRLDSRAGLEQMIQHLLVEIGKLDYRACILGASAFLLLDDYSLLFNEEN